MKVVRETMNHTLELWKVLIAGDSEENSAPIQSRSSTGKAFSLFEKHQVINDRDACKFITCS